MRKILFIAALLVATTTHAYGGAGSNPSEQSKKYSNVNVAIYMTEW